MACPDVVPPKPRLPEYLHIYWKAFWAVNSDRNMETGRISFLAIDRFAARAGFETTDGFERLCTMIYAMDAEYMKKLSAKDSKTSYSADVDDVEGIKGIFSRINARFEAAKGEDA